MNKLLWIDMEMTGLNPETEVIIEVAAVVTNLQFAILDQYHSVVRQPQKFLDAMDEWNTKHHGSSGLTALIPSGREPHLVEADLVDFCQRHFPNEKVILAGNSIGQDRQFISRHFTQLEACLHYRMLDVTSWKLIFNNLYNLKYEKKGTHRAIDDIHESISELRFYLSHIRF